MLYGGFVDGGVYIRRLDRPGDLGWVIKAHGELYSREFGWDTTFEVTVAAIVVDWAVRGRRDDEAGWIAEVDGARVGCVLCVRENADTARLRVLLVKPTARGRGLGRALVEAVVEFARSRGYRRVVLWTNHPLFVAAKIYIDMGFMLVAEEAHHSYGVDLVGQSYELDL
jgi:GNAT superfamily N-acetyltransferase